MKKIALAFTLLLFVITSCATEGKQGKHHSHKKARKQASGYFFGWQH